MTSTSSSAAAANLKICFNSQCNKDSESESESQRRKEWRLRSGEYADLCDLCTCAYGHFAFHSEAAGWRNCESCGKSSLWVYSFSPVLPASICQWNRMHCVFVCARKALSMAPNNMWSPSMLISSQVQERPKELPVKSWGQVTGSFPGQRRQGPHLWNTGIQSDSQQRRSYEFDRPLHTDRLIAGVRASMSVQGKKVGEMSERLEGSNLNHVSRNGNTALDSALAFSMHREEGNNLQDSCHNLGNSDCLTGFAGINFGCIQIHAEKTLLKGESSPLLVGLATNFSSPNGASDPGRVSMTQSQRQMALPLPKQLPLNSHNTNDTSVDSRSGRSLVDAWAQAHLLTRYRPRITDQELQQISGDSNSVITPLFENILSASDASHIGHLVLPKKCAETLLQLSKSPASALLR